MTEIPLPPPRRWRARRNVVFSKMGLIGSGDLENTFYKSSVKRKMEKRKVLVIVVVENLTDIRPPLKLAQECVFFKNATRRKW